ncbi:3641_t:CDS:2 [Ambispora leptoticha]|uniref:3641_t:CDS:1 n=1 Tax=Ambispora leptoticha TaxID=144679 RepID=A0A9N9FBU0_9GLOM|nr:3641_t:CDS:2 [Ambispora leptoticha]
MAPHFFRQQFNSYRQITSMQQYELYDMPADAILSVVYSSTNPDLYYCSTHMYTTISFAL